jgi:RNA polymerase sigma-70 factor (ECF subfamily)
MQYNEDDEADSVRAAVMSLDPKLRAVLYLYYYEGYRINETAKLLGISAAAVKWRLKRGRDKLREVLNDERG